MLVVCCGMLRSGSTLQYQLACSLVEATGRGRGLGWIGNGVFRELDEPGALHVVKVHSPEQLDGIEAALRSGEARYIYSYRDLRDVAISIQNKWNRSFRQILRACYVEYILDAYEDWMALPGGYVSRYEIFVENPSAEARAIAAHLELSLPEAEIDTLAENYTIEAQKERMSELRAASRQTTDDGVLHADHVFSGEVGQWRDALKPYQIGYLEHRARDWLLDRGYELSQPWFWRYLGIPYFWYCYNIPERGERKSPLF